MNIGASDIKRALTFGSQFRRFLRTTLSLEDAREVLQRRLASRESNFLRLLRDGVYANPNSPYLRLLQWADCAYDDIADMVGARGLEPTLEALHDAGVYITFDEFKGREPIVRHGRSLHVRPQDFDNPLTSRPYFYGRTGGTTGASIRIPMTWEHHRDQSVNIMLHQHAHGLVDTKLAFWFSNPDAVVVPATMELLSFGKVPDKWFGPPRKRSHWPLPRVAFLAYFVLTGRLAGVPIALPDPIGLDDAEVVARWAAATRDRDGSALVYGYVSQMVRMARAAADAGLDLTGVTFSGGGEPPTPAKIKTITSTGAGWVPTYYADRVGIGFGCARPLDDNDLHFQRDRLALVQKPQAVPGTDRTVDAFCFTSLLDSVPKILLNAVTDDYGVVEQRSCGCPMEELGLVEHLRHISSYRKLTGEGITLVGSDIERILEHDLPSRFGGSPLDYQISEEEDGEGLTRLYLVVSPRVSVDDESAVVQTVLDALRKVDAVGPGIASVLEQAGTLRVRRQEPVRTGAGKLMPLHVNRPPASPKTVSDPRADP
ncbi:MAG TPA: hypothetical protein VM287_10995 [Egibacteraceae bacterium]|nr:hypothetical protein [Egibacteraceae bacterium]